MNEKRDIQRQLQDAQERREILQRQLQESEEIIEATEKRLTELTRSSDERLRADQRVDNALLDKAQGKESKTSEKPVREAEKLNKAVEEKIRGTNTTGWFEITLKEDGTREETFKTR